jgi:hypothetical protein
MLNGKRYFAEFPDEDPAAVQRKPLRSPTLMATLKALEKELRRYIHREPKGGLEHRDVNQDSR